IAHPLLAVKVATETPASCSFKIPMNFSSEKRLHFMFWSSLLARGKSSLEIGAIPRNIRKYGEFPLKECDAEFGYGQHSSRCY
ncbi:hypothetical protein, partial [Mesorhizobium sp.]|uniref:hypothetical protein n=1 Tax=Mesorhizobium sp. TaxID=1871066 RepID=UPI0025BB8AEF